MIIFRVVKDICFKTKLYDYYLSKNSIEEISFTPKDIWPGDPILGDQLVQGYYNLANKKEYCSISKLAKIISKFTKKNNVIFKTRSKKDTYLISPFNKVYPSIDKIKQLGFNPKVNIKNGFQRTVNYYKSLKSS